MKYQIDYLNDQNGGNQKGGVVTVNYNNIINDLQNAVYLILKLNNGGGVLLSPELVNTLDFMEYIYGFAGLSTGIHVTSKFINNHSWIFNLTQYGNYYHLTLVNDNGIRPGVLTNNIFGFNIYPTYVPNINYISSPGTSFLINQPIVNQPVARYKVDYDNDYDNDEKLDFDNDYDIEESVRKVNKKESKKGSKKGSNKESKK